ncbi:MAG TPA: hypothetical protein VKB69_06645, partial [Micromonosporaceae bacterium]|nr:hypothetical protein [Micromonosporaceae bacterium]
MSSTPPRSREPEEPTTRDNPAVDPPVDVDPAEISMVPPGAVAVFEAPRPMRRPGEPRASGQHRAADDDPPPTADP